MNNDEQWKRRKTIHQIYQNRMRNGECNRNTIRICRDNARTHAKNACTLSFVMMRRRHVGGVGGVLRRPRRFDGRRI